MTLQNLATIAATSALKRLRRFQALRCGSNDYVVTDNGHEIMTLSRNRIGTTYAHAVDAQYAMLADVINRADLAFETIVSSGEIPLESPSNYEVSK